MKKTTFTTQYGRVPGTGEQHSRISYRPEGENFSRMQIVDILEISNVRVVSAAITNLEIEPTAMGTSIHSTYKNGGSGNRVFQTQYFDLDAIECIRKELISNSIKTESPNKYRYSGITYKRWT